MCSQTNSLIMEFYPRRILFFILSITTVLVIFHIFGQISRFVFGYDWLKGLIPLFNLEVEQNIPTIWSSFLALCGSLVSLACSKLTNNPKQSRIYWLGLFFIFLFISIDEIVGFHEMTLGPVREALGTSGFLYYAWVIPFGLITLVIGAIYLRFLIRLDKTTRYLFIFSGMIYVTGAIGMEIFEGKINEQGGYMNFSYVLLVTVEESLEMLGLSIYIYAAVNYIKLSTQTVKIKLCD